MVGNGKENRPIFQRKVKNMEEKEIFSSADEIVVSRLCDILNNQGISYIRKDGGAERYINIVSGQDTLSQKKIFVSQEDYERARKLIEFLEVEEENDEEEIPKALKLIPIEDEFEYHSLVSISSSYSILLFSNISFILSIISILLRTDINTSFSIIIHLIVIISLYKSLF